MAIRRILLIHGVILTAGGIPLIYLGDEIGTLNDYTYRDDPAHERDSRWVHRLRADWERYAKRNDSNAIEGRVYRGLKRLIELRKQYPAFAGGELEIIQTGSDHVLGFMRMHGGHHAFVFANFSENPQVMSTHVVRQSDIQSKKQYHGISKISEPNSLVIEPLDFLIFG